MNPIKSIIIASAALLLASCSSDSHDEPEVPITPVEGRTVLVYMLANSSLGITNSSLGGVSYDSLDLQEMRQGLATSGGNDGRLLVYYCPLVVTDYDPPRLIEITGEDEASDKTLKIYDYTVYSTTTGRLQEVMADMQSLAPASSYGLVFWGHGTDWLSAPAKAGISAQAYGGEYDLDNRRTTYWMDITDMASALKASTPKLDFIYFDTCLMGSVETVYELRDCAYRLVVSPTELQGTGMPYHLNIDPLMADGLDGVVTAATNTFNYYNTRQQALQITVVDTSRLDYLAATTRYLYQQPETIYIAYPTQLQAFAKASTYNDFRCHSYDFDSYVQALNPEAVVYSTWRASLDDAILYKATTAKEFNGIAINSYCGLGTFVMSSDPDHFFRGYNRLRWTQDVIPPIL
ncbi:MAG: clostripain-related cysteine peptidase [Bacteroidales bacterium]|nr:clostripain-related cysteine peptidase [Bacteroidales bacterium]